MITSKQRAHLRGLANNLDAIFQIGKQSETELNPQLIAEVSKALDARELIKLRVLNNSGYTAREAAAELQAGTGAEVVQVIGTRFVLYKRQRDPLKRKIILE